MKSVMFQIELDPDQLDALHMALKSEENIFSYEDWCTSVPVEVDRRFVRIVESHAVRPIPDNQEAIPKYMVTLEIRKTYYKNPPGSNVKVLVLKTPLSVLSMIFDLPEIALFPTGDDVLVSSYDHPHNLA